MANESYVIAGHVVTVSGTLLKVGRLARELYNEISDPPAFLRALESANTSIDIFTFLNVFPQTEVLLPYKTEWDNFAVIEIDSVEGWLKGLPRSTRRAIKRAEAAQVEVRCVPLDDGLVRQIMGIFNETPIRQGRPFPHYGKSFDAVKEMLSRELDESTFLCAYWHGELIGFVKLLRTSKFARTGLFLGMQRHRDKGINNLLVAKSVEYCAAQGIRYFVYGQMEYGRLGSRSLAEFKMNNGFRRMPIARYYVPLTLKGRLALKCGLQHGALSLVPTPALRAALTLRARWYARKAARAEQSGTVSEQRAALDSR
jgi:hypothetical protein